MRAYAGVPTRVRLRVRVRAYGSECVRAYACAYGRARRGVWGDDRPPKGSSRGLGHRTGGPPPKKKLTGVSATSTELPSLKNSNSIQTSKCPPSLLSSPP